MGALLADRNILIMGVRNRWSIAWGIAKRSSEEGAKLIFTYQGEREKEDAEELAASLGNHTVLQCDISSDAEIDNLHSALKEKFGVIHGVVHCIAHAKTEDIKNSFINTSRDGFAHALNISAYSLIAVSNRLKDIMAEGGSIITLTYMGSEKVVRGYNVMGVAKAALETSVMYLAPDLGSSGIRINAISAGPIKTMSAKGIANFGSLINEAEGRAPLKRGINQNDIGNTAVYLLSDLASGVTGEILHVDCGLNIIAI